MTTTQLSEFSSAQANAVTSSQQNALSADQLNTLVAAGHYEPVLTVRGGQIVFAAASVDHGSKL